MGLEKTKLPPTTPHHPILQMKKLQEQKKKKTFPQISISIKC